MIKSISLLLLTGLAWGKMFDNKAISFGIGDSETGISLFGLSLSKNFNEKHALFLGAGTFALVNPICIGLKNIIKKLITNLHIHFFQFSILYHEKTI
tara:strand:+ start:190 stop:480 length:291 start_codon:yes stop_codon:yes gene_type:complete